MATADVVAGPRRRPRRGSRRALPEPVQWGEQHDRLLTFVFRTFDCCVRDADTASAMTVELFGRHHGVLVDDPDLDLDDDRTRSVLIPLMAAALRERVSRAAIRAAVSHAAWQDRLARTAPESEAAEVPAPHSVLSVMTSFTRHLRFGT